MNWARYYLIKRKVTIWRGNIVTFYNIILQDVYDAGLLMNGFGSLEGLQQ